MLCNVTRFSVVLIGTSRNDAVRRSRRGTPVFVLIYIYKYVFIYT